MNIKGLPAAAALEAEPPRVPADPTAPAAPPNAAPPDAGPAA